MVMVAEKNSIRRKATMARGIKGASLTSAMIEKIVELANSYPEYEFEISSAAGLERKVRFFREFKEQMRFFDRYGTEFTFSDEARPIKRNEIFVGIAFLHDKKIARVYARFH